MKHFRNVFLSSLISGAACMSGCGGGSSITPPPISNQNPAINTVAGDGTAGYSGDGGPATSAEIDSPVGVSVDSSGNIFIADTGNSVIRKVDSSGKITTIAGTGGVNGFSGDGGPATSAILWTPLRAVADHSGNIYIADSTNARIRKVDTTGVITTFAGTGVQGYNGDGIPATTAELSLPGAIAVDANGNVYIADTWNHRIRKIDTTGNITTIAGTGFPGVLGDGGPATMAQLNEPEGVTVDASGNVYIADSANSEIRKIDTTGVINTIAGNRSFGYSGDGGPGTTASLNFPTGVAVDTTGNVYIADFQNSCIRKVATSGVITTLAGNGTPGFSGDGGPPAAAELRFPQDVAVDTAGHVYIADNNNMRIRKIQ